MAAGKFSFMDIVNVQSKAEAAGTIDKYTEIFLSPYDVKPSESNFYSQNNIEELADSFLTVGQQQPTVLGRVNGEFKIISGHRRNLANILNIERGREEYKSVRYLYRDMTEATFELSLLVGNAYNRELTPYEKTEQAKRLKAALIRAQQEDGLEIQGKLRDVIAEIMGESSTNVARMESINNNLTDEAKEEFKKGNIGITAAYEASKLPEDDQKAIAAAAAAGEDVRAKEIAAKVAERKAGDDYKTPHPESITSLCYHCLNYVTCNVKTGTCEKCDEYVSKADAEKTDEQRYNEEQDAIDRETARKLREQADTKRLEHLPSEAAAEKVHEIKIATSFYEDVASRKKTFELRKNDRGYKVGDGLKMLEFNNGKFTGRTIEAVITYMLEEYTGLQEDYCILGIETLKVSETDTEQQGGAQETTTK
jgi:ParB-like chromosome segregation protein Spo0J